MRILIVLFIFSGTVANAIKPEREYRFRPDQRGLAYTEYQVKTPDNYLINVWEYGVPDSIKTNRTIILVNTDAGNMGYFIWEAYAYLAKGFRVVSFDYRGFGKSSDFAIDKDFLFHHEFAVDLDSVIKQTREKYPNDRIGLHAMSMGTYVSLLRKEKIDFLVAEGFYHNPQAVVDRIKVNKGVVVGLPANSVTVNKMKNRVPVLIFCADKDKTTTTDDAREFAKRNKVTLVEFEGEHLGGLMKFTKKVVGDEYVEKVVSFLGTSSK